jgi:hypothetical protein
MPSSTHLSSFAVALFAIGCSSGASSSNPDAPTEFVAHASDFTGFHSWSTATASAAGGASDGLHGVGPLEVYWNQSPPHGSTTFPVGTIIVKETEQADVTQRAVFAMVKRGDGFNSAGANGWEWFSLQDATDGTVTILWSGLAPSGGETYANQPIGDCNGCHALASSNDSVWDSALQLSNF